MGTSTKQKTQLSLKEKQEPVSDQSNPHINASVSNIKELLCPFYLYLKNLTEIKFQSRIPRFARTFFVNTLPRFLKFGDFLKPLYNFGNTNTSIFIYPLPESICQTNLNEIINQVNGELLENQEEDINKINMLLSKKMEAGNLRDEISTKFNRLFEITILSTVFAKTPEELDHLSDLYGFENSKSMVNIKSLWAEQEIGFRSNLPCNSNKIFKNNTFDSFAAATTFPFWCANNSHPTGIPLGTNIQTSYPIFLDDFYSTLPNLNFFILGNEKSNKKIALKLLVSRSTVLEYIHNIIIDARGSFYRLTKSLYGTTIKVGPESNNILNPFELEPEVITDDITGREKIILNLDEKIEDVTNILMTMARGPIKSQYVNNTTREIIQQAVIEEYESAGINTNPESLYGSQGANLVGTKITRNKKALPTIGSWYKRISAKAAANTNINYKYHYEFLIKYMKDFIKELDGSLSYYDGQSNFDLSTEYPVSNFDISKLDDIFSKPLAMQVILSWLKQKFVNNNSQDRTKSEKKRIIADEAYMMLAFPEAASSLCTLTSQTSSRNISLIIMSANAKDFCIIPKMEKIMRDAGMKLLLRHEGVETEYLRVSFNLTYGEREFIGSCNKNEGILVINNNSAQMSFAPNDIEIDMI